MAGFDDDRRDGARSGIWKMVYADFTTAMMAFFLVLWLASTASEAQRDLLADFFNPVSIAREKSGADGVMGGRSADTEGTSISDRGMDTDRLVAAPPVVANFGTESDPPFVGVEMTPQDESETFDASQDASMQMRLDEITAQLRLLLDSLPDDDKFMDVIIIERRPTDIEIALSDQFDWSMFERGRADLTPEAQQFFRKLGLYLSVVPSAVRIAGHTDGAGFNRGGSNWELSAGRANAARRAMESGGLNPDRIVAVEGRADRDLFNRDNVLDARNRRITVNILATVTPSSDLIYGIREN